MLAGAALDGSRQATFPEVGRILRTGGVFAAYDCDWPPTMNWEAEQAFERCRLLTDQVLTTRGLAPDIVKWDKQQHLARMRASEQFRFVKEVVVHHIEQGNAERLVGLMMSQGALRPCSSIMWRQRSSGSTPSDSGRANLGTEMAPWYWGYRVQIGIR